MRRGRGDLLGADPAHRLVAAHPPAVGADRAGRRRRRRARPGLPARRRDRRRGRPFVALGAVPVAPALHRRGLDQLRAARRLHRRAPGGAARRSPRSWARRSSTGGSGTASAAAASGSTGSSRCSAPSPSRSTCARCSRSSRSRCKPVLDHDVLVLTELDATDRTFRVVAYAGEPDAPAPEGAVELSEAESQARLLDYEIIDDIRGRDPARHRAQPPAALDRHALLAARAGAPVGRGARLARAASIASPRASRRTTSRSARRLADRVALVLSHHRLAEEARIAAEARERAERLEATVETLTRELESRERGRVVGRLARRGRRSCSRSAGSPRPRPRS